MANYAYTCNHPALADLLALVDPMTDQLLARASATTRPLFNAPLVKQSLKQALNNKGLGPRAVLLNGSHLLLFHVTSLWYGYTATLLEELFVRVAPGPLAGALAALETLAKDLQCSQIALGSLLVPNDEAYTRLVTRHGYALAANIMIKEIT